MLAAEGHGRHSYWCGAVVSRQSGTMDDLDEADPAAFIARLRALGIGTAIIAWQEEYGQQPAVPNVVYGRLHLITLLGYHQAGGRIVRCRTEGGADERGRLRRLLEEHGITVEERSRNIVKYG
jgi:hypothetical protein